MRFELSEEQRHLQEALRKFFTAAAPSGAPGDAFATGPDDGGELWRRMSVDMGLPGLMIGEEHGGAGAGLVEASVVMEEMGRAVVSAPFLSSVVLTGSILRQFPETEGVHLPRIADGSFRGALAALTESGSWNDCTEGVHAVERDGAFTLDGSKTFVVDGESADLIVVVGRSASGVSLFVVDGGAPGLRREPLETLDRSRPLARLTFDGTPARLLGEEGRAMRPLRRALAIAAVALGAEQIGGATRCLELSTEYATRRLAFGRPIGSFQAVKHKLADMYMDLESARAVVYHAAWSLDAGVTEAEALAAAVRVVASRAFVRAAQQSIQIHGAIGVTHEHECHLHLKRARGSEQLLGSPDFHLEHLARHVGLGPTRTAERA